MDEATASGSANAPPPASGRPVRGAIVRVLEALRSRVGIPWLLTFGFVVLVVIGLTTVLLVVRTQQAAEAANHSLEVENAISTVQLLLRRSESGQRGFLLTGETRYREMYDRSINDILPAVETMRALVADNPDQQAALDRIDELLVQKVEELRETVDLYAAGRTDDAIAIVRSDRGEIINEALAPTLAAMKAEERRLTGVRTAELRRTSVQLLVIGLAGLVLIVLLAVAAVLEARHQQRALRQAGDLLARTNANLERMVAERTADLTEANDEIQRFAYIVSHDLRAPLVNIMGFTSELEALRGDLVARLDRARGDDGEGEAADDALVGEIDEALRFIKASIARMDRLINAILKISREGRREFRAEPVDMAALIGSIGTTPEHQLQETGTRVTIGPLPRQLTDRLAVEQVFTNLVDNAIKYLRPGVPGAIAITCTAGPGRNVYLVEDNGRGIAEQDRDRVFELFRRAGVQDRPGEGIGLAHVRTLVRRLGGSITVESSPGSGSRFRVTLPTAWTAASKDTRP